MEEADRAYDRALTFLEKCDRTEREVFVRLTGAGFSEDAVTAALEQLRDAGLVNDADYAARYLEALASKGRGRLRIAAEMRRKGLPEELVRETLEDGLSTEDERAMAKAAARRFRAEIPEGTNARKAERKVSGRLTSLGFTYEDIGIALRELRIETEDEDEDNEVRE